MMVTMIITMLMKNTIFGLGTEHNRFSAVAVCTLSFVFFYLEQCERVGKLKNIYGLPNTAEEKKRILCTKYRTKGLCYNPIK